MGSQSRRRSSDGLANTSHPTRAPQIQKKSIMELSTYEKQRLEHMRRNYEYLKQLGLVDMKKDMSMGQSKKKTKKKRRREDDNEEEGNAKHPKTPRRRSGRQRGDNPEYTGETIDNFFAVKLERISEGARSRSRRTNKIDAEARAAERERMIAESIKWISESRKSFLNLPSAHLTTSEDWKAEAVRRWGDDVGTTFVKKKDVISVDSQGEDVVDWKSFVESRMSNPPAVSPYDLLQEYYSHDTWRLLISCVLMSRVSSAEVKHRAISEFFKRWPTPSSAMRGAVMDPNALLDVIAPLGLFDTRYKSVRAVTEKFLRMPIFAVGLKPPTKIYGIGAFGVDSFNIFCRGNIKTNPTDRTLKMYCGWAMRNAKKTKDKEEEEEKMVSA